MVNKIFNTFRSKFWNTYLRINGARIGKNFKVEGSIEILLRDGAVLRNLTIGDNVSLGGKTYIRMRKNGRIKLESFVKTGVEVWLVTANDSELTVGENTILGSYSIFNAGHGLKIGSHSTFAAFVYINTSDHSFRKDSIIQKQGFFGEPVEIGDDVWIGGHVFINKGVRIGNGAVVGAGAIVTKDIPEYTISAGNPAHIIKERI